MCGSLTLEPDVHLLIEAVMAERGWSLSQAVNEAIRHSSLTHARTSMELNTPLSVVTQT
jgi:hypothetical protein